MLDSVSQNEPQPFPWSFIALLPSRGHAIRISEVRNMEFDRITIDPALLNGQPCIRNMRLTVRRVVELAALYPNRDDLRLEYPELEDEDVRQALLYAASYLDDRVIALPANHETAA